MARILAGDLVGSVVLLNMLSNAEETPNGVPEYMGRVSDLCSSVIACTWVLLLFAGLLHFDVLLSSTSLSIIVQSIC